MNGLVGEFAVTGERGFSYVARAHAQSGFWGIWSSTPSGSGPLCYIACASERVSLDAGWSGTDFTGTATLDGRTYERVGSASEITSMFVRFTASLDVPAPGSAPLTLVTPFWFSGMFHHGLTEQLVGSGWATAMLTPVSFEGQPLWSIRQVRYDFSPEPIPEPSTLLLVAGGAAWVGTRWRRRRGKP